ncbi:MAG: glycerate kinase, partial [Gluconacetobacter diazotrophicus]|nr:glycerate kinase [Gluconacetobacter diazotrophicus]
AGVAALARRLGKPVLAFGGTVLEAEALRGTFDGVFALQEEGISTERAMREAEALLEARVTAALATHEVAVLLGARP